MSCRQSSPPEAPSGQKSILWCLPAFVPEKSFQALSSLLAPALGAWEGGRKGFSLPWQQGKKLDLTLSLELHPWTVGEGLSRGRWRRFSTLSLAPNGRQDHGLWGPGTRSPWAPKKEAAVCLISAEGESTHPPAKVAGMKAQCWHPWLCLLSFPPVLPHTPIPPQHPSLNSQLEFTFLRYLHDVAPLPPPFFCFNLSSFLDLVQFVICLYTCLL